MSRCVVQCPGCVAQCPRCVTQYPGCVVQCLGCWRNFLGVLRNDLGVGPQWPCTIETALVDLGRPYPESYKQEICINHGQKVRSRSTGAIQSCTAGVLRNVLGVLCNVLTS